MDNEQNKHPHAEIIAAWEKGEQVQYYDEIFGEWQDCPGYFCLTSRFEDKKFRVKPEEGQWKPHYGERYFFVDADGLPADTYWLKDDIDLRRLKAANVFKSRKESQASSKRVIAAFRGEESEEVKKLREENEELKLRCENLHKAKEAAIKQAQECSSLSVPLSDGELALIRAVRQADIAYAWERGAAILIDKESFEAHHEFIAFLTSGDADTDDEIRAALNAISREQEQEDANDVS